MKRYGIFVMLAFLITGCGKKLPKECTDYIERLDQAVFIANKKGAPEAVINMYNTARSQVLDELSKLDTENQIRICKLANTISP